MSLCVFCALLCLASGGVFFADYALFTDPSTGFAAMGSVWLRYGFLALLLFRSAYRKRIAPLGA